MSPGQLKQRSSSLWPDPPPPPPPPSLPPSPTNPSTPPTATASPEPGTPAYGRRGTLSKRARPRGASWLPTALGKPYPPDPPHQPQGEPDDDEASSLLSDAWRELTTTTGRSQGGRLVVAAKALRKHVLLDGDGQGADESGGEGAGRSTTTTAAAARGDEEDVVGLQVEGSDDDDGWLDPSAGRSPASPPPTRRPLRQRRHRPVHPSSSSSFFSPSAYSPALTRHLGRKLRALRTTVDLWALQLGSLVISSAFLGCVVTYALLHQLFSPLVTRFLSPFTPPPPPPTTYPWDDPARWRAERIVGQPGYYARQVGCELEDHEVETDDGFLLKLQRVVPPPLPPNATQRQQQPRLPILILHGLFQSSGSFITSEERSLAFWLASCREPPPPPLPCASGSASGGSRPHPSPCSPPRAPAPAAQPGGDEEAGGYAYDVWLGNTRGVFGMGHRHLARADPRFWDWTIRELAVYDMPALVDEVRRLTGWDKIAFIGHSQGNGTAFVSLSLGIRPDLGPKLALFVALAPAVFAGPLTHGFPFTALGRMEWKTWRRVFGVLDFIPVMTYAYDYAPQALFASLGYTMFAFLFAWTDTNWLARRKAKMFRFTPSPVSSASIFWWAGKGGFATRKCLFDVGLDRWFDERFPPLSIYYGGRDYLVLTEPLLERLATKEPEVELIRAKKIELSEHCDFYWAAEAVEWCYHDIVADIERTRPPGPSASPPLDLAAPNTTTTATTTTATAAAGEGMTNGHATVVEDGELVL